MSSFTLIIQFSQNAKVSVHVPATQGNMKVLQHSSYTYTHWLVFIWGFSSHKYKYVLIFLPDIYINERGTKIRIAHEKFRFVYLKKDLTLLHISAFILSSLLLTLTESTTSGKIITQPMPRQMCEHFSTKL